MNKKDIAAFFDRCAPWWDDDMIRNEQIIAAILNNGGIRPGVHVLDVACGTGVLFPDYIARGAQVTGIDISPEMVKLASEKFPQIPVLCGDVEETEFDRQFDCVMVYNAFPHFSNPRRLIEVLSRLVKPGGKLSVAHGMSRATLLNHHKRATNVSIDLIHERELAEIFSQWFSVDVMISTDQMYQVCGIRKDDGGNVPAAAPSAEEVAAEETQALLQYMVNHNDAHAQELTELASQLKADGKLQAYRQIMDAVADFDTANAKLALARKLLSDE
jgi:demethylmenaquinone methyltransferase/2-methoxy-6-polyprenyl-1,4-benzoquinol methylase